jgi:putative selenium metabolism protein SsnA
MIITNATLLTLWENKPLIEGALVALEGKTIVDFGKVGKLIDRYDDTQVLDVRGRVLIPGLVNGHSHLWRTLAPGVLVAGASGYRELQEKFWWRFGRALSSDDIFLSALVGLLDAVRGGFTTVIDHHFSPRAIDGSLDVVWRAFEEVGLRGCLSYGLSDVDGETATVAGLAENSRFLDRCRNQRSDMMSGLFGLDASCTVSDRTLSRAVGMAREQKSGFHVHVSEDVGDVAETRKKYQQTPVDRLVAAGVIKEGSLAAQCIHMLESDYEMLGKAQATVLHSPQSNAFNAVGLGDLGRLNAAKIAMALGTDGFSPSLLEEFRAMVLQQRMRGRSPSEALELAFRTAFSGNADLATLLFGPPLGRIKPGARADLLVLDYIPPTPLSVANLADHFLAGLGRAAVKTVIVNGQVVLHDGIFTNLDEAGIRAQARQAAKKLWERM